MKRFIVSLVIALFFCSCAVFANTNTFTAGSEVSQTSIFMRYKDISRNWRVINKMKTQAQNLTNEEKSVIKKYVFGAVRGEDTYLLINCYLRDILQYYVPAKEITKPLKYRLDYYARSLSVPIAKTKLPQNMILYRGIDEKGMKYLFSDKKIDTIVNKPVNEVNLAELKKHIHGAVYVEKGFMSTSYDINCTRQTKFILEVNAPKNLQAVLMEDLGKKQEKEVIINKGTKWEVTDITIDTSKKTKKDFYRIKIKFLLK